MLTDGPYTEYFLYVWFILWKEWNNRPTRRSLACHSPINDKSLYTSQIFDLMTSLNMNNPALCIILIISFFLGIFNVICLAPLFFHHRASIDLTICRRTHWWAWHLAMIALERHLPLCGGKAGLSINLWEEFDWNSLLSD